MAKYTEEQKAQVLARISETGIAEAAKEAGIPISTVSKWGKAAKMGKDRGLNAKAEESSPAEIVEASKEAYAEMIEAEAEAVAIIDAARKESDEAIKEEIKDKTDAAKIEMKKKITKASRKAAEKKKTVKEMAETPIRKARTVKTDLVFETNGGRQITPEAITERVPKGVDAAYIKLEENKIYWVKGTETGAVDIWE